MDKVTRTDKNEFFISIFCESTVSGKGTRVGGIEDNETDKGSIGSKQYYESRKTHTSPYLFLKKSIVCIYMSHLLNKHVSL